MTTVSITEILACFDAQMRRDLSPPSPTWRVERTDRVVRWVSPPELPWDCGVQFWGGDWAWLIAELRQEQQTDPGALSIHLRQPLLRREASEQRGEATSRPLARGRPCRRRRRPPPD